MMRMKLFMALCTFMFASAAVVQADKGSDCEETAKTAMAAHPMEEVDGDEGEEDEGD